MGKLLMFPQRQEQYSGNLLNAMMQTACQMTDERYPRVTLNCLPARGLEDRCVMDVPVIGDPNGVYGVTCNQPMYFRCVHCGPLCVNCLEEFGCCAPGLPDKHEEDIPDDGA